MKEDLIFISLISYSVSVKTDSENLLWGAVMDETLKPIICYIL